MTNQSDLAASVSLGSHGSSDREGDKHERLAHNERMLEDSRSRRQAAEGPIIGG